MLPMEGNKMSAKRLGRNERLEPSFAMAIVIVSHELPRGWGLIRGALYLTNRPARVGRLL